MKAWKRVGAVVLSAVMMVSTISVPVEAKSIVKLSQSKMTLFEGKTSTLKVTGTKQKVSWSTSDKKVATVSKVSAYSVKANCLLILCSLQNVQQRELFCRWEWD